MRRPLDRRDISAPMRHRSPASLERLIQVTAWTIAVLLAITAPVTFFLTSHLNLIRLLESRAELVSNDMCRFVLANPDVWRADKSRLGELLGHRTRDGIAEAIDMLDRSGAPIATNRIKLSGPLASHTDDIYDADNNLVARIRISRSLDPLLLNTFQVALCSTCVAIALFLVLRSLPMRIIQGTYRALEESEKKYRSLYQAMNEGLALHRMTFDDDGNSQSLTVIDANPSCAAMFDGNLERIIGGNSFELFGNRFREFLSEQLRVLEHGDTVSFEVQLPNTEDYYLVQAFSPDIGLIATLFENITERRKSEQQIQQMAYFDTLTGLPNRALFLDRLNQAIARARREHSNLAVLFLDLDRFKNINDTLGHTTGDELLIEVSRRLRRKIRGCDTLARLGGDEFVAIITGLGDKLNSSIVAQSLIEIFNSPFSIRGNDLHITTSIGIALFPDDGINAELLIKNADMAMYSSKESGRNAFNFYSPVMNEKAVRRMEIEVGLRTALDRNEFFLEYQPVMNTETGAITAVEALARWNHSTLGRIPPHQFIPLAEETGLILPLGEWVLREACKAIRSWNDAGLPPVRVSVNVSSRQVEQQNFAEIVRAVLRDTGATPSQLEIELTESSLVTHAENNITAVFGMRDWGISIAIDDFGTGFSSLSYVKTLPIDHLKIDRSFIQDVCANIHDQAIVETIIALSHKLGIQNVAEGVETADQVAFLKEHGCDELQGFFYHPPQSREAMEGLLRAQIGFVSA